ncbi:type II secretion system minor pseudopilin GspH [Hyphococcus flavus]|uniref:Type II secretion system protein H n=1 Tax=Hyphococcus flavus TaxID=1866326 RepID=A0AAE9ZEM5_9PROT|nr:type II secretion system minor pseudopilin GspH [Hyphococcus flavus]WDI31247.1 type II secretion system minor pseudopilin GspH [Hyphococcus flavus]
MLTSAIGPKTSCSDTAFRRNRSRGLTLVELLVVLAIIAMAASVVVLNAPPPARAVDDASEKLAARIDFAAAYSVTAGVTLGLEYSESGYRFLTYRRGEWSELTDPEFAAQSFPADIAVAFAEEAPAKKNERDEQREEDEDKPNPAIRFTPTGETTPLEVRFQSARGSAIVVLDNVGKVRISKDKNDG